MNPLSDDPSDFTSFYGRGDRLEGEAKLLWEVLNEALRSYARNPNSRAKDSQWHHKRTMSDRQDARDWLLGEGIYRDAQYPFSSETICEYLGVDVEVMRKKIRQGERVEGARRGPLGQQKIKARRSA